MKHYLDIHKLDDIKCDGWNGTTGIKSLSSEGLLLSSQNGWETYGWYVPDAIGKTVTFQIEYMNVVGNYRTYINNQESVTYAEQQNVTYSSNWTSVSLTVNNALSYFTIMLRNEDSAGKTQSIRIRNVVILYEEKSTFEIKKNGIANAGIIEGYDEVKIERNNFRINPNLFNGTNVEYSNNDYLTASYEFDGDRSVGLIPGQRVTVTFCATPASNVTNIWLFKNMGGSWLGNSADSNIAVTGGKKNIYTAAVTISNYNPSSDLSLTNLCLFRQPNDGTVTSNTTIHWVKVEEGDKFTGYVPSKSEGFEPIICENPVECNEIKEI